VLQGFNAIKKLWEKFCTIESRRMRRGGRGQLKTCAEQPTNSKGEGGAPKKRGKPFQEVERRATTDRWEKQKGGELLFKKYSEKRYLWPSATGERLRKTSWLKK